MPGPDTEDILGRLGVVPSLPHSGSTVGISLTVLSGTWPINALRHPQQDGTCGWYIWAGEALPAAADFFKPLHVEHVADWCPLIVPFLGLPPGWRVLLAPGQEEVWFDAELLSVE